MELTLLDGGASPVFVKTIFFESNLRVIPAENVTVSHKGNNLLVFNVTVVLNLGEVITFRADWTAKARAAGRHRIDLFASSDDPDVDPSYKECEDAAYVEIVEGAPIIHEPTISPVYSQSVLPNQGSFLYPRQEIWIRCEVTCPVGIGNVTLYDSVDSGVWNQTVMNRMSGDEWVAILPGQSEGSVIVLYVEAFSSTGESSRTEEYAFTVADLEALEFTANIVTVMTAVSIFAGCTMIFFFRRWRINEMF